MKKKPVRWYKMDSSAALYSALQSEEFSSVYRFSVLMAEEVDPAALQRAIARTMPRFPGFGVRIRQGLFWYYLEPNPAPGPFLREDVSDPCQPFRFHGADGWLVRFYYYRDRISFEAFHALSDGAGAMTFFRTLLAVYLTERGHAIPPGDGVLDVSAPPRKEELEDAYARHAGGCKAKLAYPPRAYDNTGTPEPFYVFHVTMGFVPLDLLRARARSYGASVTEYLASALLWVILERQRAQKPYRLRPVAVGVPLNLRRYFPTETLRNFITTLSVSVDPRLGDYTFPEIVDRVRSELRLHSDRHELRAGFTRNVRFTSHPVLQFVPLFLKNPVMALNYRLVGVRPYSATYTNPGIFYVPDCMRPYIRGAEVILGQAKVPRSNCASISYDNTMEITFAGTQVETDTERAFFRFLIREGLPVRVESNR